MSYSSEVEAAVIALDAHTKARGIDDENSDTIALYHLLNSLLTFCDTRGIDFDAELSCLRSDIAASDDSASPHPFQYDHTSLVGVSRPGKSGRS